MLDLIFDNLDTLTDIDTSDIDFSGDGQYSDMWDSVTEPDTEWLNSQVDDNNPFEVNSEEKVHHVGKVSFGSSYGMDVSFNPYASYSFNAYDSQPSYLVSQNPNTIMGNITVKTHTPMQPLSGGMSNAEVVNGATRAYLNDWVDIAPNSIDRSLRDHWAGMMANDMGLHQAIHDSTIGLQNQFLEINRKYGFSSPYNSSEDFSMKEGSTIDMEKHIDETIEDIAENTPGWKSLDLIGKFDLVADKVSSFMDDTGLGKVLRNPSVRASLVHIFKNLKY